MDYDLVIKGGNIIDGSGNPWFKGDIAIFKDKIQTITRTTLQHNPKKIIDATGLIVAPGFIDPHSHADTSTLFYREI